MVSIMHVLAQEGVCMGQGSNFSVLKSESRKTHSCQFHIQDLLRSLICQ